MLDHVPKTAKVFSVKISFDMTTKTIGAGFTAAQDGATVD